MRSVPGYRSLSELSLAFAQKSSNLAREDFVALDGALGLGGLQRKSSEPQLSSLGSDTYPSLQSVETFKSDSALVPNHGKISDVLTHSGIGLSFRPVLYRALDWVVRITGWIFDVVLIGLSLFIGVFVLSKINPKASSLISAWVAKGNIFEVVASLILAICMIFLTYRFSFFLILGRTLGDSLVGWLQRSVRPFPDSSPTQPESSELIS